MPIPTDAVIRSQRRALLAKVEDFAAELLADLGRRGCDKGDFWFYINFCSPMVLELIAWERIHAVDLREMPSVKRLFFEAARAALVSVSNHGHRDPELDRGQGRRTFREISEAELAANILPRLEQILHCWGITYEQFEDTFIERTLTDAEVGRLTKYYGQS